MWLAALLQNRESPEVVVAVAGNRMGPSGESDRGVHQTHLQKHATVISKISLSSIVHNCDRQEERESKTTQVRVWVWVCGGGGGEEEGALCSKNVRFLFLFLFSGKEREGEGGRSKGDVEQRNAVQPQRRGSSF